MTTEFIEDVGKDGHSSRGHADLMPYVEEGGARNLPSLRLSDAAAELGPAGGRVPLVGLPAARCVLLRWQPGVVTTPHRHPRALEMFLILEGEVRAWLGATRGADGMVAGPGTLLLSQAGQEHRFEVLSPDGVLLLAIVAPNEDRVDETVESAADQGTSVGSPLE